jgi:hypothetical protein
MENQEKHHENFLMPDSQHDERLSAEIPPENNIYCTILHQHSSVEWRAPWRRVELKNKFKI